MLVRLAVNMRAEQIGGCNLTAAGDSRDRLTGSQPYIIKHFSHSTASLVWASKGFVKETIEIDFRRSTSSG